VCHHQTEEQHFSCNAKSCCALISYPKHIFVYKRANLFLISVNNNARGYSTVTPLFQIF
jgi:hypothetical protein